MRRSFACKTCSLTELLFGGGTVYTPDGPRHADVHVTDGVITQVEARLPAHGEAMAAAGAIGFKAYLAYSFSVSRKQVLYSPNTDDPDLEPPADYGTLAQLAPTVARLGLPMAIHAEDPTVLAAFRRPLSSYDDL